LRLGDEIRETSDRSTFRPFAIPLAEFLTAFLPAFVSILLSLFDTLTLFDIGGPRGYLGIFGERGPQKRCKEGPICIGPFELSLLLALAVSLIAVLASSLGVLLSVCRVLFGLSVVALFVMLGGGAVRFGSILVVFGCFVVFVSSHGFLRLGLGGRKGNSRRRRLVPRISLCYALM
jgi:hypothetical protein